MIQCQMKQATLWDDGFILFRGLSQIMINITNHIWNIRAILKDIEPSARCCGKGLSYDVILVRNLAFSNSF